LLVRNPDYYLKDKDGRQLPYVDAVRLLFTKDPATDTALFRTRQLDVMRVSTLDVLYALMKTVPDMQLYRVPSFGWGDYGVSMALDKAPYSDVRVRQALSMAVNREVVAEVINRGDAALYGPFPWALAGYTKRADYTYASLGPNYEYNVKKAKELLAAAGYPKGFDMELEWAEFQGWTFNEFVQLVARFFGDVGVRVKLSSWRRRPGWPRPPASSPSRTRWPPSAPSGRDRASWTGCTCATTRRSPGRSTGKGSAIRSWTTCSPRGAWILARSGPPSSEPSGSPAQNVYRITTIVHHENTPSLHNHSAHSLHKHTCKLSQPPGEAR